MNGLVRAEDIPGFFKKGIYKEARRLITLVEDIIKLSKLDEESVDWKNEDVELYELTREIVSRLSPQCSEKKSFSGFEWRTGILSWNPADSG